MLKLAKYLKPFVISILVILILVLFQAIGELYLPTLMADIVNEGIVNEDTGYIVRVGGVMLLVALASVVAAIFSSYMSAKVANAFGRNLRNRVFSQVEGYSLNEFDKIGTSSLITRTTNDINQVQAVVITGLRMMVRAPLMGIGGIVMALSMDSGLSIIFLIALPILVAAVLVISKIIVPLYKSMQIKVDNLNRVSRENLTGIRVIRAFNRVEDERIRFDEANADLTNTAIKANKIMATMMPLMMVVMNITSVAIIWFGSKRVDIGALQVGEMMAFLQYAMLIMMSLFMISMIFVMIPRAQASAIRINQVLNEKSDISDPENPVKDAEEKYNKGNLEFRDVEFTYPGAEKPVLTNISFEARPGEVTAIIGGTGSGKSTLINLIPRFYDIPKGEILIDGVNIRKLTQEDLRAKIGLVPQKALLFTGTVEENIRMGKDNAGDVEIQHAAEIAQAIEFITELQEGFKSNIAQGGANLSGGQKQRLSIARALVRKPKIYIFDDSFSALDFKTDAKLRQVLKKETMTSTVLIVAQRISTIINADKIIVLDQGQIVGTGTHSELINNCEIYKEIASSQLSEEELA